MKVWPKISIITPSLNQGEFIEETILSILNQNYPNLEYIIIDGGSTDNSVEIIKKYEDRITYWISEKDEGQSDAINKGLSKVTGDWFNWINSDDLLAKDSLYILAKQGKGCDVFAGGVINFGDIPTEFVQNENLCISGFFSKKNITTYHQPGFWFKAKYLQSLNIKHNLNYCFDLDLTIQILLQKPVIKYTSKPLAHFRFHYNSKSTTSHFLFEKERYEVANYYIKSENSELKKNANDYINARDWWDYLKKTTNSDRSKLLKIYLIGTNIFSDFSHRFNRMSLSYIKNIIIK